MTGPERREQLIAVGRKLFADKGFEATTVEEVASKANVSKPVVYEHFGGKEGLYAVVVDREIQTLMGGIGAALEEPEGARVLLERATLALLDYIETDPAGFRILVRDSPPGQSTGSFASVLGDVAVHVEHLLAAEFKQRGLDPKSAPIHAQMLVGHGGPDRSVVAGPPQVQEGPGGGAPRQPGVERPLRPRAHAPARDAPPPLTRLGVETARLVPRGSGFALPNDPLHETTRKDETWRHHRGRPRRCRSLP